MNLLIVSTLYPPHVIGGAERSTAFLAEAVAAQGHDVTVATTSPEPTPRRELRNGVDVRYLPLDGRYWPFAGERGALAKLGWHIRDLHAPAMRRAIAGILDEIDVDVMHTNNIGGFSVAIWDAAARRGIPVVHTLRDYYLLCPRTSMFRGGDNCRRQCLDCRALSAPKAPATRAVHTVVGNSRFILERHLEHGLFADATSTRVIFNAYEPPTEVTATESTAPRSPADEVAFGYLGRLSESKGLEYLLDAANTLPAAGWRLVIGGRGSASYEASLRVRAGRNVEFAGFVDPAAFLRSIDVLVVPSLWHEPLPRTIYEAYAHGVPVLSSNRGGSPEIVEAGRTGFVFDPADGPDALSARMAEAVASPESFRNMRDRCLAKARAFLPERTVEAYLDAYLRARDESPAERPSRGANP